MAELSLYLTNVNISLGKAMDVEKSSNMVKEFESVELGDIGMKKQKVPRRTIYFASGETMEEYSTDEEEEEEVQASIAVKTSADPVGFYVLINSNWTLLHDISLNRMKYSCILLTLISYCVIFLLQSRLTWGPYFLFHMWRVATSTISVCDYLGERMASLFGITSPKYQYAIDEYYRMKKEDEEEEEENRLSEEAERRFKEERNQEMQQPAMEQPEGKASFVNVTFELDQDATPDANRFPAPIPT